MKKKLIPAILILALAAGCSSKQSSNANTDTTGGHPAKGPRYESITTEIMPPQVVSGQAGATTVKLLQTAGNNVQISVLFVGNAPQTLIIDGTQFSSTQTGWAGITISGATPQTVSFTPQVNGANYPKVFSTPVAVGVNTQGIDATVYFDNLGDAAIIYIQDMGLS